MNTVLVDIETTDLVQPLGCAIEHQPHIIEVGAIQITPSFKIIKKFETLVKPPVPIPVFITRHTGISDMMVMNAPEFWQITKRLAKVFKGAQVFCSHNVMFDRTVLEVELKRAKKKKKFPMPPQNYCTAEQSFHICGHRMKLEQLFEHITGEVKPTQHRAMADCKDLLKIYKGLKK